jgi:hypothetical protein
MLWTEPAGVTPGKTRGSTHFSLVRYGEHAYSEVRRFIVINNKGQYSQCMYVWTLYNSITPSLALTFYPFIHYIPPH